jgi:hypothetical protein
MSADDLGSILTLAVAAVFLVFVGILVYRMHK